MNVNNTHFTQAYQTIRPPQAVNERPVPVTPEQKVATAANVLDLKQPNDNFNTYLQAYQNATGADASNTTNDLTYDDIQNINQSMTRYHIANSDALSNYIERQPGTAIPTPYLQPEMQTRAGDIINTFA